MNKSVANSSRISQWYSTSRQTFSVFQSQLSMVCLHENSDERFGKFLNFLVMQLKPRCHQNDAGVDEYKNLTDKKQV